MLSCRAKSEGKYPRPASKFLRGTILLLCVILALNAAATRLEISGDILILSYTDSRDSVIFRREGADTGSIPPMKIDIPGTWTLDALPQTIPDISHNRLWPGISGDNYSYTLTASSPAQWSAEGLPDGLACSASGKISGVPKVSGVFSVDVTASNSAGKVSQLFPLKVFADHLPKITSLALPPAVINASYDFRLTMNDSPASVIMAGEIPSGLTLDDTGRISGTPSEPGDYTLDITAANEAGESSAKVTLTVSSADMDIAPDSLSDAHYGRVYRAVMRLSGTGGGEWRISGKIPRGLSFDSGILSGTPSETGKFPLTVTGGNGAVFTRRDYTLSVRGDIPAISTSVLKQGFTGMRYSFMLRASSRNPVTWSCDVLPEGLSLDAVSGVISGVPAKDYDGRITVQASTVEGRASRRLSFSVKTLKPQIKTLAVPDGFKGEYYHADFISVGGAGTAWSLRGKIPAGLSFSKSGVLEGIPEEAGRFTLNISAENPGGKASRKFSLTISENEPHEYITAAIIPPVTVSEDGRYDFYVNFDSWIPEGTYIEFHSFPYGIEAEGENYTFVDTSGRETGTVPANRKITVRAYLEGGVRYEPVISARVNTAEGLLRAPGEQKRTGCSVSGIVSVIILLHAIKKRAR